MTRLFRKVSCLDCRVISLFQHHASVLLPLTPALTVPLTMFLTMKVLLTVHMLPNVPLIVPLTVNVTVAVPVFLSMCGAEEVVLMAEIAAVSVTFPTWANASRLEHRHRELIFLSQRSIRRLPKRLL